MPPPRRHRHTASIPQLDITSDGDCHRCPGRLPRARCPLGCTRPRCWLMPAEGRRWCHPALLLASPHRLVPLSHASSRGGVAGAGEVLSRWGWRKLCVTPRPARGASVPGGQARAGGGPPSPHRGLRQTMVGGVVVFHKHFPVSTCPWPVPGGAVGGRGWEAVGQGGGGLFTATELVSFHLPRGKQLAIC